VEALISKMREKLKKFRILNYRRYSAILVSLRILAKLPTRHTHPEMEHSNPMMPDHPTLNKIILGLMKKSNKELR